MKNCPKCGSPLTDDARFCTSCGAGLTAAKSMPPRPSSPFDEPQTQNQQPHRPPTQPIARPPTQQPQRRPPMNNQPRPSIGGRPVKPKRRAKPKRQPGQPRLNETSKRKIGAIALVFLVIIASTFVFLFVTGFGGILGDKAKFFGSTWARNKGSNLYHVYTFNDDGTVTIDIASEDSPIKDEENNNLIDFEKVYDEDYTFEITKEVRTGEENETKEKTDGRYGKGEISFPLEATWEINDGKLSVIPKASDMKKWDFDDYDDSEIFFQGYYYEFQDEDQSLCLRNSDSKEKIYLFKTSKNFAEKIETVEENELKWSNINITMRVGDSDKNPQYDKIKLFRDGADKGSYSGLHCPSSWGTLQKGDKIRFTGDYEDSTYLRFRMYWRPTGEQISYQISFSYSP